MKGAAAAASEEVGQRWLARLAPVDSNQHRPEVRTMSHGAQGLRDATCQVDICRHDARQGGSTAPRGQTPQGVLRMQPVVRELLRAAKPVRVDVNEAGRH